MKPVDTRTLDCLVEMLEEMRKGVPAAFLDADRRDPWFEAVAQLVQALPRRAQQWAWVALIATDLSVMMPEVSLPCSAAWVQARLGMGGPARP